MTDPAAPADPAPAAPTDPAAIIRSRSYIVLLLLGAVIGVPVAAVAYFFLDAVAKLQTRDLRRSPCQRRVPWRAAVVAASVADAERAARRSGRSLPPRNGRPRAFGGFQSRRAGTTGRILRHHRRGLRHAESRCRPGPGGTADRDRERTRRSCRCTCSSGTRRRWRWS